jgi:Tfp pilus assembly protein PilV
MNMMSITYRVGGEPGYRRVETGFTLVENMVGMVMVGMTCLALYGGMTFGLESIQSARETERATQIVAEKLDTIRLYSWDKISTAGFIPATFTSPFTAADAKLTELGFLSDGFSYQGSVSIETNLAALHPSYRGDTLQVTVTLSWTNARPRQAQMTTLVARNGLYTYIY